MLRKLGSYPPPERPGDRAARTGPHRADAVHSGLAPERRTAPARACRFEQGGEARNALARAVFIHRLGEIRDRTFEQQRYRASGLNLVTAAIVLWNTVYLERATLALREKGKLPDADMLQFLSPLDWEHINLKGDYVWRQQRTADGGFRELR